MSDSSGKPRPRNEWIPLSEKTLVQSPVIEVAERLCRSSEDSRELTFYVLKSRDWCNIIPITEEGRIVLVRQYRIGISQSTLEFPGGVIDPSDTDLQSAALREMAEETGYEPLPGANCQALGWTHPNPAILNNRLHFFIVGPVRKTTSQNLDAGEMIETVEVTPDELISLIARDQVTHALMLNPLFALMLRQPEGALALKKGLSEFSGRA